MPAVYKDSNVELLNEYLGDTANFQPALDLLNGNQSLTDITAAPNAGITDSHITDEAGHFQAHWLSEKSPLAGKHVDDVMRYAYKWAIELAGESRGGVGQPRQNGAVPIETFWLTTGPGGNFEIHVSDGDERVTVFVFIPVDREYGSRTGPRSWAVRVGGFGEHEPPDEPRVERLDGGPDAPSVVRVQTSGPRPT
jgi:hypothetical protein